MAKYFIKPFNGQFYDVLSEYSTVPVCTCNDSKDALRIARALERDDDEIEKRNKSTLDTPAPGFNLTNGT